MRQKKVPIKIAVSPDHLGVSYFFLGCLIGLGLITTIFLVHVFTTKPSVASKTPLRVSPTLNTPSATDSATKTSSDSAKAPVAAPANAAPMPPTGPGVPILTYHYIGYNPNPADHQRDILSITPDKFDAQMGYLAQAGYTPISLDTLYGIFSKSTARPRKPIVLTFDDGYIDFFINAYPILKKYGFHAVAFIPTGLIGRPAYMDWGQIKALQADGLVSLEAHSVTHPDLPTLPYPRILSELQVSKQTLQAQIGYPVNFVAYPYGAVSQSVIAATQAVGYIGGVGTWFGRATGESLVMPRIRISGSISLADFTAKVAE